MAVALRLTRFGKKGFPAYRIVAMDKRKARNGMYLENIGTYQPIQNNEKPLQLNKARYEYWTAQGAQISEGLARLLKNKKAISFVE